MPKRTSRQATPTTSLQGTVQIIGARPKISLDQRAASVADLRVTFTGGTAGAPMNATFTVTLNTHVAARSTARLTDETTRSTTVSVTTAGKAYVFEHVQFPAPGPTASRRFRFTNIRANATALSGGSAAGATPVIASISISGAAKGVGSTPIRLSNATQEVAVLAPRRASGTRRG